MNKIYKVIWNKARNCYVAVSEIANAHSKGGKRARAALLSAVLSIGLAASGSVFASEPASTSTVPGQYVAGKFTGISSDKSPCIYDFPSKPYDGQETTVTLTSGSNTETITYVYDESTDYWVRKGYKLVSREYQTTDLAKDTSLYDIVWTDATKAEPTSALNTVTSLQKANGTMTNMGEALEALTPTKIEGVTNSSGTRVYGSYNYIIVDSSWKDQLSGPDNYRNGYTDLIQSSGKPLGFITAEDPNSLSWDENHQCYVFTNKDGTQDLVNYHNTYVLDIYNSTTGKYESKIGVFTKADGSLYTGNVYGKHNEILTTTKGADGSFYSYWGSMVTDQALTMGTYYVTQYKNDLDTLVENDNKLYRNDIRSVDMKLDETVDNKATLSLYRNGSSSAGSLVDGQLTITRTAQDYDATTGTAGKDTQIEITGTYQDGTARTDQTLTLNTGSRVSVATQTGTDNVAETITVNGREYKVSLANAAKVVAGTNVTVSEDTDTATGATTYTVNATPYTAGDDTITIDATNHTIKANSSNIINKAQADIQNIVKGTEIHVKPDTKAVGDDGTVTFTYEDGNGDAVADKELKITGIAKNDLSNITNEGETVIKNLAGNAIDIKSADDNLGVTSETKDGVKTFTLTAKDTTYTAGNHVSIDATDNNKISVNVNGTVAAGDTNIVSGDTVYNAIIKTASNNDIKSGSIGNDGKVTLTKNDNSTIEVGTVKDYSVTAGTYDSTNKKITLTKTNAYGGATDTVDIDLTALEDKISQSGSDLISKGFALIGSASGSTEVKKNLGEAITVAGENGINVSSDGAQVLVSLGKDITIGTKGQDGKDGEQGQIGLAGKDGTNGKDGSNVIEITVKNGENKDGKDGKDGEKGAAGVDGKDGKDGITRIVYQDKQGEHQVATMEDGLKFGGDTGDVIAKKLNNQLDIKGGVTDTTKLTDNNIGVVSADGVLNVKLAEALSGIKSITNAGTTITIKDTGLDVGGKKITNVAKGEADTDAVNKGQLDKAIEDSKSALTTKGFALEDKDGNKVEKKLGEAIKVVGENGINVNANSTEGQVTVSLDSNITIGTKGEDGKDGAQGHIGLAGKDGENIKIIDIRAEKGAAGVDGKDGKDGITRIIYKDGEGDHQIATLDDGLLFGGDSGDTIAKKLNEKLEIKGGATGTLTDNNIGVISDGGVLKVKLANALSGITSITNGGTTITLNNGVTITGGDLNVSNKKIVNVADGTDPTDAVNKGQLDKVKEEISTLGDGAVMYDTKDGKVDYTKVTMGGGKEGTPYSRKEEKDDDDNVTVTYTGGTTITNVSYAEVAKRGAEGYDGSQAVNMDRLNDSIADAMSQVKTDVAGTEKHIKADTYEIENGKVTMQLVDGNENPISGDAGKVIINDVAKASELGKLNSTTETHEAGKEDGILKDSLKNTEKDDKGNTKITTVVDAINKVDDKVEAVKTDVTNLEKNFTDYKSETNTKIENIINDVNRRSTTVTVNGNKDGNLKLVTTKEEDDKKVTFDISLSDKVTLGKGDKAVTLDGTTGEASISKKLTVGTSEDGVTIAKTDLGTYTKDITNDKGEILHKKGDNLGAGHTVKGLDNTTIHTSTFATEGKAATEEQLKEALGDMDFDATIKNQAGETVNKYNIVNTATNVTEAVYQLDQSLTQANARIDNNTINIQKLSGSLGKLNTRVNRVGAGAAALAALHPLDFDPDDKWDFAAGYGNYAGANATAIGAYYRPNEDTMLSIAGSFGGGENMVNAGVSFKLGRGNHVTTSKVAMAKEIKSLRATVEEQGKQIAALTALVEKLTGETVATPEAPAPQETFTVDTVKEEDGQPVIERVRTIKGA